MTQIIWLASYPRSGNTWLRFLLYNLHQGAPFASHQVDKLIPSFHRGVAAEHFAGDRPTIVKTHLCYRPDMPLDECTAGAIYIYRHPMAVMASNVRYVMRLVPYEEFSLAARRALVTRIVTEYTDHLGLVGWHKNGYGSWDGNIRSWIAGPRKFPVLVVRYESLTRDPLAEITRICDFLGLAVSAEDRLVAVKNASEETLKAMEELEVRHGWPGLFANFVNGGSRRWRFVRDTSLEPLAELVSSTVLARAAETLAVPARRFGYE
ncbi:MAG: sulfotransferase domain-containing protein [Stellaceae bacterium]